MALIPVSNFAAHSRNIKPQYLSIYRDVQSELSSYKAACQDDPFLKSFDCTLQKNTNGAINTLADGIKGQSSPVTSLKKITDCFVDSNRQVVKLLLHCKTDISKNDGMRDLVKEYFDYSGEILNLCDKLQECITRAKDSQFPIQAALDHYKEAKRDRIGDRTEVYSKTLKSLQKYKTEGNLFTEELSSLFDSVYKTEQSMLEKFRVKKTELDNKLKSVKTWRTVSHVILGVTCASLLICSLVVMAICAPPAVMALGAAIIPAAAAGLEEMGGGWIDYYLMKYENELKSQNEKISSLESSTLVWKTDLDHIASDVKNAKNKIQSMLHIAEFALNEEASVTLVMEEIKMKMIGFMETITDLSEHTDTCRRHVIHDRKEFSENIIKLRKEK
ncbi:UPF0496 protein 1-like [Cornus florida]|uniref:UPF0496 protein 1-like n=1 Tax=Cornus florida TaxID=4283 RepID=UPI002897EC43|nr:UPF0496 protein 1-like [Cornus florida]